MHTSDPRFDMTSYSVNFPIVRRHGQPEASTGDQAYSDKEHSRDLLGPDQ